MRQNLDFFKWSIYGLLTQAQRTPGRPGVRQLFSDPETSHSNPKFLKLSFGRTSPFYLLEIEGLFTQGSRPGRTFGDSVGGFLVMDGSDWSNGIRYHIFVTRPDTEFKAERVGACSR